MLFRSWFIIRQCPRSCRIRYSWLLSQKISNVTGQTRRCKVRVQTTMAEFSPYQDYLGLNALVVRLTTAAGERCSNDWPSPSYSGGGAESTTGPSHSTLQDFDIIKLSRVFNASTARRNRRKPLTHCVFCKNNGECQLVFASHRLKDDHGAITCPILRAYTCPLCGCSGDKAHTIKYCPSRLTRKM